MKHLIFASLILLFLITSCEKESTVVGPTETELGESDSSEIVGFYLLNEGNWGSNKSTLDYYNATTGIYSENIYAEANPTVVKELGDVGNDLKIYGSKLYAVINASNKVEILDAKSAKRISHIDIDNARYIIFNGNKGYVSSYAGPISFDNNNYGEVIEFDTTSLEITRRVTVGYQPEEMEIIQGKLYVANSGGYMFPNYDNTVSIIDLNSFTEIKKVEVAINLHKLKKSSNNKLYISSRGDYDQTPSNLYEFDPVLETITHSFDLPASNYAIKGDSLYLISSEYNWSTGSSDTKYILYDLKTKSILNNSFIPTEYISTIKTPYGIYIHPISGDIYLTDAIDYVSPGILYSFNKEGVYKWKVTTGDIPSKISFLYK